MQGERFDVFDEDATGRVTMGLGGSVVPEEYRIHSGTGVYSG
jgi:hypothetical protein